eukprot:TRINITY_DN5071_c0_g1_i2.p1 TRINITY_DN5071_c0_g1~~TRINITY_DN5071_c0_g1_i2.p1  ORF type:complete len:120 (-),score=42.23 TRINITY_DN5071_c0_g1_i2:295-654(-)
MTSLLVRFLQKLNGGLMDTALIILLVAHHDEGHATASSYLQLIKRELTPNKQQMMLCLFRHWQRVVSADNRMDAKAMATCAFMAVAPDLAGYRVHMDTVLVLMETLLNADPEELAILGE